MKTLAIILGTVFAILVLTVAAIATVLYINAEEEEFSRGGMCILQSASLMADAGVDSASSWRVREV